MTPERLEQIQDLYHAAQEAWPADRAALLGGAEPELRREVESLLARQNDRLILDYCPQLTGDAKSTGLDPGLRLGPYELETKIGEGGMGEVFRAIDTRLSRPVAIKFAHEHFSARFEREARAISSLNHPNICTLYDIGPNYLVMELLEGDTVADRLKNGPLPTAQAVQYALQIAAALADAHEHGIVHRDLKPSNIMIVKSGVKVLDFGVATRQGDDSITGSRMVFGTPAYMAPEQRDGKPADVRTDLYSFGCIFYEMLTGARATSPGKRLPSKALSKVVDRCLQQDPARRWQSASDLLTTLQRQPRGKNFTRLFTAAAVVIAVFIAAAGARFFLRPAAKLTDRDVLVLADFVNKTGDTVFDDTLRQGLAMQLEQSPFLKIMDDEQLHRVLHQMRAGPGTRITNAVAHEICVREGAAATVEGAISSFGKIYAITLRSVACQDGATLAQEQVQTEDKERVLNLVGSSARSMRAKLGESLSSIQKRNRPLEQATTFSLEALHSYTAGYVEMTQGHSLAAVPFFERAVALDPAFAMGYEFLGIAFEVAGDMTRSREYSKKAFELIERVSEDERDRITAYYYLDFGELDKAIDAYQLAIRNYPRVWSFHNNLGMIYVDVGQYEDALKEGLEAARLQPDAEPPYRRQLDAYICMDRLLEAKQLAVKLQSQGLDRARIHQRILELAYVEDDHPAIDREIQWFAGKPEEYLSPGLQAAQLNVHGKRRESRGLYRRAADTALRQGLRNAAAEFEEADAQADALVGNCQPVRRLGRPALALAICGETARAERLAAETSKVLPNGTMWNAVQLPSIRAAMALARNKPSESVELLASALPYDRASFEAVYLRGLAYLKLKDGPKAAIEFEKIVRHKGANWASAWRYPYWGQFYSISHLGLARAWALTGDRAKSKKAFEEFFTLWKDADPDIPLLHRARAEYAGQSD